MDVLMLICVEKFDKTTEKSFLLDFDGYWGWGGVIGFGW